MSWNLTPTEIRCLTEFWFGIVDSVILEVPAINKVTVNSVEIGQGRGLNHERLELFLDVLADH